MGTCTICSTYLGRKGLFALLNYLVYPLFIHTSPISVQVTDQPASTDVNTSEVLGRDHQTKFVPFWCAVPQLEVFIC